jgi:hypothetical protein|tara:strand:- start:62 stop:694 length:633 start_codon:yes stop_codon:yes gene_type:complete
MADYKDIKYNVDYSDTSGAGGLIALATAHQATTDGDDGTATFDFTSLDTGTYDTHMLALNGFIPHGTGQLQLGVDTGTNTDYDTTVTDAEMTLYHQSDDSQFGLVHGGHKDNDAGPSNIGPGQKGSGTVDNEDRGAVGGFVFLYGLGSSTFEKHFISKISGTSNSAGNHFVETYEKSGYFQTTTAITRLRIKYSTGNIDGGRATLYGLVK